MCIRDRIDLVAVFLDHICFEDIADLQVAKLLDAHAALVASCNLFDVVFETFEGGQMLVGNEDVYKRQPAHSFVS